jgi:hypothetical protein
MEVQKMMYYVAIAVLHGIFILKVGREIAAGTESSLKCLILFYNDGSSW